MMKFVGEGSIASQVELLQFAFARENCKDDAGQEGFKMRTLATERFARVMTSFTARRWYPRGLIMSDVLSSDQLQKASAAPKKLSSRAQ
jgi:hypothetical protein